MILDKCFIIVLDGSMSAYDDGPYSADIYASDMTEVASGRMLVATDVDGPSWDHAPQWSDEPWYRFDTEDGYRFVREQDVATVYEATPRTMGVKMHRVASDFYTATGVNEVEETLE